MKRFICFILLFALVSGVALAQESGLGSLGEGLASAFKRFGTQIADASVDMYESVKGAFEENGPEIAGEVSEWFKETTPKVAQGVSSWVDETAPKVTNFFSGLWNDIKRAVN